MNTSVDAFPPVEVATKLLVAIGIGLLVGLEREWAHKDLGVRSFTIVTLLGMLAALLSPNFVLTGLAGVIVLIIIVNVGNLRNGKSVEATTSGAVLVTYALGVLVGEGHVFTPTASAIVMTLLLATKPHFSKFAGGLTEPEVRGAVLLGLIGFVVYPILPNRFIDPWQLLHPREAWLTIIFIATIGFGNYVLLRLYSARGIYYAAFFGGLVNSTATIADLSGTIKVAGAEGRAFGVVAGLTSMVAMFVRNLAVLSIISPPSGWIASGPVLLMAASASLFVWREWKQQTPPPPLTLGSPFRIGTIARFGVLFVAIQVAVSLGERFLGAYGAIAIGAIGGFTSSASATAAVASLAGHERIAPNTAAIATVVASVTSASANLPILYRATRDRLLLRTLIVASLAIVAVGAAALFGIEILRVRNH